MATPTWTLPSNTLLDTIQERTIKVITITNISGNGTIVTVSFNTQTAAPFTTSQKILINGVSKGPAPAYYDYNGIYTVIACTTNHVTFASTINYTASVKDGIVKAVDIPLFVTDTEDTSTVETNQFSGLDHYANKDYFYIRSTGLATTPWIGEPVGYQKYSPRVQSYVFKIPLNPAEATKPIEALSFIGVAIDGVPFKSPNSGRIATISTASYTENNVIYPVQDYFTDGSGIIESDRKFYYQSNPTLLNRTHTNGHSKILGYAFDGHPIYGPYGYSNGINGAVRIMESSYRLSNEQRINGTLPDGTFIEDFVYDEGFGDLDQFNGRECFTPDYDEKIYAYFVTVDADNPDIVKYPYIIGPKYHAEPIDVNGFESFPGDIGIEVISGSLPPGMRIEGHSIAGTPYEVSNKTEFRFVLRASNLDGVADRTFSLIVEGADSPRWETPEGDLPIGTVGKRTFDVSRRLIETATANSTRLYVSSARGIKIGSTVSTDFTPNPFASGTKVTDINLVDKYVRLSNGLVHDLEFKVLVGQNQFIKDTTYTIKNVGTTNWLEIGAGSATINTTFVYNGTTVSGRSGTAYKPFYPEITFSYEEEHVNMFILDNSEIDYQLSAIDNDTAAGQTLTYYIPPKGGSLPPGISLTPTGKLVGFAEPVIASIQGRDSGTFDTDRFDEAPYDFAELPTNGFSSFGYDMTIFDYSDPVRTPIKLNRYYEFVVRASDGIFYADRRFRIFVVGDDFFRADDTIIHADNKVYTADVTFLRKPVWVTPSYLGRRRANNYVTIYLDVYDPATLQGKIGYILESGTLPPGMYLDQITGEIYGAVPRQPAVSLTYEFTVMAIRYDPFNNDSIKRTLTTSASILSKIIYVDSVADIKAGSLVTSADSIGYVQNGTTVVSVDIPTKKITLSKGLATLTPTGANLAFTFLTSSTRKFTLDVMGDIESTIHFTTDGDLGEIDANFVSTLSVEAVTSVANASLRYLLVGGKLPPGLSLVEDGTIQGKVNQFGTEANPGLTIFDSGTTSFDNFNTTVDRTYLFTVQAKDQFGYSAVTKTFNIAVATPNNKLYSNIFVKPFMKSEKRIDVSTFLTNPNIFVRNKIFRPGDPEFGIQTELRMLLYPGIETKTAAEYVSAFGRSSKKRFRTGAIKKAVAKKPGTNTSLYEVIYLEVIDNLETDVVNNVQTVVKSVSAAIPTKNLAYRTSVNQGRRDIIDSDITDRSDLKEYRTTKMGEDVLPRIMMQDRVLSADYDGQLIGSTDKIIFGNSTSNIRKKIEALGDTERNYLPLWMRTPQTRSGIEQGFTKAIPICYCLPGEADYIMLNIKNSGFDFTTIDLTIDRVIIDSVTGESGDKYIAFAAREVING
jgi:hypothetical protein